MWLHFSNTAEATDSLSPTNCSTLQFACSEQAIHACLLLLHLPDTAVGVAAVVEHCCCDWVQP